MDTFFPQQIALCSADSGKNQRKEETFSMIKSKASTTILGLWLEYSQADNSQFRNLKTIHFYWTLHHWCAYFGRSGAWPPSLIWAWRAAPVQIPPHTVSLWARHFPLLHLLHSFPPRLKRPRVCTLEVGLLGGWGGGVYMELLSCVLITDFSQIRW